MRIVTGSAHSRRGLTLIEMVITLALIGTVMTMLSFHLVGLSNLWLNRTDDDFFEQHVDGVVLFLTNIMEASETAAFGENQQRQPVEWARPPGWGEIDDPLLYFQQNEAPALFVREGLSLPAIMAYIHFDERDGLSILWYSALDSEDIEEESDLRRTRISRYITRMDYAYYDLEADEWEITGEPVEEENDQFMLPDFIRLTFNHPQQGERVRSILIPHGAEEIPLF